MGQLQPIVLREQQKLDATKQAYVDSLALPFAATPSGKIPLYLGLSPDGWSSYYVGASWLRKESCPLIVLPKFDKIDYIRIFAEALNSGIAPEYFNEAYSINFDTPAIQNSTLNSVLSPLIVSHFLSVVNRLLKRGLKRNYIIREENLKCKVKGHILLERNFQKNIIRGHSEKVLCRYQDYSLNYPENQIIKRALLASKSMILALKSTNNELLQIIQKILFQFEGVDPNISPSEVKSIKRDKLHGEYPLAINLAKLILRRTDFSISENTSTAQFVPEFAIDMSRVFEFHVLGLLKEKYKNQSVLFQEYAGIMGRCDYLIPSEQLIIDAKYKEDYPNRQSNILREDIREVSGYGRSNRILKKLGIEDGHQPTCIIIYPNGEYKNGESLQETDLTQQAVPFNNIENFYSLGVAMPAINDETS